MCTTRWRQTSRPSYRATLLHFDRQPRRIVPSMQPSCARPPPLLPPRPRQQKRLRPAWEVDVPVEKSAPENVHMMSLCPVESLPLRQPARLRLPRGVLKELQQQEAQALPPWRRTKGPTTRSSELCSDTGMSLATWWLGSLPHSGHGAGWCSCLPCRSTPAVEQRLSSKTKADPNACHGAVVGMKGRLHRTLSAGAPSCDSLQQLPGGTPAAPWARMLLPPTAAACWPLC